MGERINIARATIDFNDKSFGNVAKYLVDVDNPLPTGVIVNTLQFLTDIEGFECIDHTVVAGGADYPTTAVLGDKWYGQFESVVVTSGTIACMAF